MKIYSGSGLLLTVILMKGKSLGTETPLGMIPALPGDAWIRLSGVRPLTCIWSVTGCWLELVMIGFGTIAISDKLPPIQGESTEPGMTSEGMTVLCPGFAQPTARLSPPAPSFCSASM